MAFTKQPLTFEEVYELLELKFQQYHQLDFIATDPISIPHRFTKKEDIEIAAFFSAIIAWGQRTTIINNANRLMELMYQAPYDFILHHQASDLRRFEGFKHRTFQSDDVLYFMHALQQIYRHKGGLEKMLSPKADESVFDRLNQFHQDFFQWEHLPRSRKHIANPAKGSSAKRLNMFLRWMVRDHQKGVDFGIWKLANSSQLMLPLDVHTARVARRLGLLERTQNDWKAVQELSDRLREFDPTDPVKYDYALFGLGVFEKFGQD